MDASSNTTMPELWWSGPLVVGAATPAAGPTARSLLPSKDQVDHAKSSLELLLLVVGLPYLIWTLMTNPGRLFKGLGTKHLG